MVQHLLLPLIVLVHVVIPRLKALLCLLVLLFHRIIPNSSVDLLDLHHQLLFYSFALLMPLARLNDTLHHILSHLLYVILLKHLLVFDGQLSYREVFLLLKQGSGIGSGVVLTFYVIIWISCVKHVEHVLLGLILACDIF